MAQVQFPMHIFDQIHNLANTHAYVQINDTNIILQNIYSTVHPPHRIVTLINQINYGSCIILNPEFHSQQKLEVITDLLN